MINRRKFIMSSALASVFLLVEGRNSNFLKKVRKMKKVHSSPIPMVISTWDHGVPANEAAWKILSEGGSSLDAVEQGVRVPEADPESMSVGYGGLPDREGKVTLDACIMDKNGNCGSVTFLEHIKHPISVARLVMEKTPHVMLSGVGALKFALDNGFKKENLLTEKAEKAWKEWLKKSDYKPTINIENHDTIGMLSIDQQGDIAGACTTSGAAYKMHGRVGDSPIIGAGLYIDNEVGGAVATGLGELVMKTLGAFLIVEFMRNGYGAQEACEKAVRRIVEKLPDYKNYQVGYLAVKKNGDYGSFAIQPGFTYAINQNGKSGYKKSASFL